MTRLKSAWLFLVVALAVGLLFCWTKCQALDPCPPEPQWNVGREDACPAPGPCHLEAGQVIAWNHALVDVDLFIVCASDDTCKPFVPFRVCGPECCRVVWPGVHVPISPHRYWDRGGSVALTVQACNSVGCSDPVASYVIIDPWLVPLQVIE